MRSAAVCVFIVLAFALAAGCVSSIPANNTTSNATAISPSPIALNPGYLVYTNDSYNFSIEYPANWTAAEGGGDDYSYHPGYVTSIVTFYPPQDNRSSQYDGFTVALDRSPLASSDPVTLTKYMDFGLRHYYEELPYCNSTGGSYTNVSSYPAIETNVTYYYNTWVRLRGRTFFIIAGQEKGPGGLYRPIIYRLEYRASDETFDDHLETVMRMAGSLKIK